MKCEHCNRKGKYTFDGILFFCKKCAKQGIRETRVTEVLKYVKKKGTYEKVIF